MNLSNRAFRLTAQISLLTTLLALSAFLLVRTYLGDEEQIYQDGAVTEVVEGGPVTIGDVTWKLDSLQPHTKLVNEENKEIELGNPAGSVIIVVKASVTPLEGLRMNDGGFSCEAELRDDRGNVWKNQSASGLALPTYCSDDDHPIKRNQTAQIAQVYFVPASAVPHLTGIQIGNLEERRRVLLTR